MPGLSRRHAWGWMMTASKLGNLIAKWSFVHSLWYHMQISWDGRKEIYFCVFYRQCRRFVISLKTPIRMYSPVHITQMAVERNHNLMGAEWTKTLCITKHLGLMNDMTIFQTDTWSSHFVKLNTFQNQLCDSESGSLVRLYLQCSKSKAYHWYAFDSLTCRLNWYYHHTTHRMYNRWFCVWVTQIIAVDKPKFMGCPPDHPWWKTGSPK